MNMEARDLEPCPFCDGEAEYIETMAASPMQPHVRCKSCGAKAFPSWHKGAPKPAAIKAWNTRTHSTEGDDVERVARAINAARYGYDRAADCVPLEAACESDREYCFRLARAAIASMPSLSRVRLDALEADVEQLADTLLDRVLEQVAGDADRDETLSFIQQELIKAIRNLGAPNVEGTG